MEISSGEQLVAKSTTTSLATTAGQTDQPIRGKLVSGHSLQSAVLDYYNNQHNDDEQADYDSQDYNDSEDDEDGDDDDDEEAIDHHQRQQDYDEDQSVMMLTAEAQRLATAMLCYHDFIIDRVYGYIQDNSVFFSIANFLNLLNCQTVIDNSSKGNKKTVANFLTYVLNYTGFMSAEVCNFFIKFGCDAELVSAKNKDFLNDDNNQLTEEQLKMARHTLNLHMHNENSTPRGNNFVMYKRLNLSAREKLIIAQQAGKNSNRFIYLDLLADDILTVEDSTDQSLLNEFQLDYLIKKFRVEQYINYLAINLSDKVHDYILNSIPIESWLATVSGGGSSGSSSTNNSGSGAVVSAASMAGNVGGSKPTGNKGKKSTKTRLLPAATVTDSKAGATSSTVSTTMVPKHITALFHDSSYSRRIALLAYKDYLLSKSTTTK